MFFLNKEKVAVVVSVNNVEVLVAVSKTMFVLISLFCY